jgi:YD repeat-containing protein
VLLNPTGERTTYQYDAVGRITALTHANGTSVRTAYNAVGWTTQVAHRKSDGSVLETFDYTYANGNLLAQEKPTAGTTTFTWGHENELLTSLEPDGDLVTMIPPSRERRSEAPQAGGGGGGDQLPLGSRAGAHGAQRGGRDGGTVYPRAFRVW